MERKAGRLLAGCTCPLAIVHAGSGACNTESSYACAWYEIGPHLFAGGSPACQSMGRKDACQIVKRMAQEPEKRSEWLNDFLTIRQIQTRPLAEFSLVIEASMGWFKFIGGNE